jgi:hypothetical protein
MALPIGVDVIKTPTFLAAEIGIACRALIEVATLILIN